MSNYEIMLVVSGSLSNDEAKKAVEDLEKILSKTKDFKFTDLGHKDLSYQIKNDKKGWYFLYNFSCNIPQTISEFNRLAVINKNVLRTLIVNLDKDYGARAKNNPKKIKDSEIKLKLFNDYIKKYNEEKQKYTDSQELSELKLEETHE